jgi:hypothetical protein
LRLQRQGKLLRQTSRQVEQAANHRMHKPFGCAEERPLMRAMLNANKFRYNVVADTGIRGRRVPPGERKGIP